jgi:hypothetical protein
LVFNRRDDASPDDPFARTFYPDAIDVQSATKIRLSSGQQISDADIHVKNPVPTRQISVRLRWGDIHREDYTPPEIVVTGDQGRTPYPFKIGPDTYVLNLFLGARYTIRARAFCLGATKGEANTGVSSVDGQDLSTSDVALTFAGGKCSRK